VALSKQAKDQHRKAVEKVQRYKNVFDSVEGRWVLNDMMAAHGMLNPHPSDPHKMVLKEGERLVILRILTFLKENPERLKERIEEYEKSLATS